MALFLKRLGCVVGRHAPSRREVQYVGRVKVGPCRYCNADLEKSANGRWVKRRAAAGGAED